MIRGGFGIFYNTQGNGSALFRLHRQLPFGPSYSATVDQFSAIPTRVQDGLPPIPASGLEHADQQSDREFQRGSAKLQDRLRRTGQLRHRAGDSEVGHGSEGRVRDQSLAAGGFKLQYQYSRSGTGNARVAASAAKYCSQCGECDLRRHDGSRQLPFAAGDSGAAFPNGLAWLGAYTYSHSIDNVPTQQGGGSEGPMPQDIRYRFLDRGSSAFDIRHRTSQSVIYDLPFGKGRRFEISNSFARAVFGDWQMNGILTLQSGLPFTPTLATSVSNSGGSRPDRPWLGGTRRSRRSRTGSTRRSIRLARHGQRRCSTRTATAVATFYADRIARISTSRFSRRFRLRNGRGYSSAASSSTCSIILSSIFRMRRSEARRRA